MSLPRSARRLFAAGAVALAAAALPAAASAAPPRTIKLDATTVQRNLLDLGDPGLTLGDQIAFSDDLRTRQGEDAGFDGGNCTMIRIADPVAQSGTVHCRVTYALAGGQVTTQGLLELTGGGFEGRQTTAITGGTGRYRGARGEATLRFVRPGSIAVALKLR